jgi:hypothetical protein
MILDGYEEKLRANVAKKKLTKNGVLATEIWTWFSKRISFPMLMGMIKSYGYQAAFEAYSELKKQGRCSVPLFVWMVGKDKIKWKEVPKQLRDTPEDDK